jgi:hypothetical protein
LNGGDSVDKMDLVAAILTVCFFGFVLFGWTVTRTLSPAFDGIHYQAKDFLSITNTTGRESQQQGRLQDIYEYLERVWSVLSSMSVFVVVVGTASGKRPLFRRPLPKTPQTSPDWARGQRFGTATSVPYLASDTVTTHLEEDRRTKQTIINSDDVPLDRPIVLVYVGVYAHKLYGNIAMGLLRRI